MTFHLLLAGSSQLSNFQLYIINQTNGAEELVYDNSGIPYETGVFIIDFEQAILVELVVIRRPTEDIITLCEVVVLQGKKIYRSMLYGLFYPY